MTTNERIKEIAEKYDNKYAFLTQTKSGTMATVFEQAILESTKDLSATIEAQKKEIEELMKDKQRLDWLATVTNQWNDELIKSCHSWATDHVNFSIKEIPTVYRQAIDSTISKQKE